MISNDNAVRTSSEQDLKTLKATNPALLFSYCLETLNSKPALPVVQMALFIIKREFVIEKDEVPAELKPQLAPLILSIIQAHGVKVLMNIGAEILCNLTAHNNVYQSFLQELEQICKSPEVNLRMFGLIAFETITAAHLDVTLLENYATNFLSIFKELLSDKEVNVRMQAVKTTSTFLASLTSADLLTKLGEVIIGLVTVMIEALNYSEDDGKVALEIGRAHV